MATYYFLNTGSTNFNLGTNWSLTDGGASAGVVPGASDIARFTALSGNCNLTASVNINSILFTGAPSGNYSGTFTTVGNLNPVVVVLSPTMNAVGADFKPSGAGVVSWTSNGTAVRDLVIGAGTTTTINIVDSIYCRNITVGAGAILQNNNVYFIGNLATGGGNGLTGTSTLNVVGTGIQTWTCSNAARGILGSTSLVINCTGTFRIIGVVSQNFVAQFATNGNFNLISGTIDASGCNFLYQTGSATATFNSGNTIWSIFSIASTSQPLNLVSDLYVNTLSMGSSINNFNVYVLGGANIVPAVVVNGTSVINLIGSGTLSNGSGQIAQPIIINTPSKIIFGSVINMRGPSLTYIKGKVDASNTTFNLVTGSTATLNNMDKIAFKEVVVDNGKPLTMNKFFSGSPDVNTFVRCATTGPTQGFTVTFTDGFEKTAKFVKVRNCRVSRPLQLLVTTSNSNQGNNVGVRFINQSPNGISKNDPSTRNDMAYSTTVVQDPAFLKTI